MEQVLLSCRYQVLCSIFFLLSTTFIMNHFLQWNCRGLLSNLDDVHDLFDTYKAACLCLQETYLHTNMKTPLRRHNIFRKDRNDTIRASGGVAILTRASIPVRAVNLDTELEAVAVQMCLDRILTVCSLYLPPGENIAQKDIEDLCNQLPTPFILLGDFNAHNPLWGSARTDGRGKMVEKWLLSSSVCLLNTGTPTYIHSATQTFSALDLSFCSPSLFGVLEWSALENPLGSDHFPVLLRYLPQIDILTTRPPRWKLQQADWNAFSEKCNMSLIPLDKVTIEEANTIITNAILDAATQSIPQTSGRLPKRPKPWWNEECEETRKMQNRAWGRFRRYPTIENLLLFKKARAKARWTRKQAKRSSWHSFVSSLSITTPSKLVWERLRKIRGIHTSYTVPILVVNGRTCDSLEEQADALGEHFEKVSSSAHYTTEFLKIKTEAEKKRIPVHGGDCLAYNQPFTEVELNRALVCTKSTSPGPDRVMYTMLSHLPKASKLVLLEFFNQVWIQGTFPSAWKIATVIPLLKSGKESSSPTSYRPIALTSCIGKTFERMVNNRLVYFLEENKCLSELQCGFRTGRSTTDHLVRVETMIREAFVRRQHCLSVFFDLEKAYDTAWRYGILRDLHHFGIKGRLLRCISNFLQDRRFRVRLGTTLSRPFVQENGVPQGSVLSVTLFLVKINSVANVLPPSMSYSLYVDDIQISFSSMNLTTCERQVQLALNKLTKWSHQNGFKFSHEKTVCVHFKRVRGMFPPPNLKLNGQDLAVQSEHKFLGVTFDSKLTFLAHIKNLKVKCIKSLNLLKVLSHKSWGADRDTLHRIYAAIVRSKLDYGCVVYGSARKSVLKVLDPVHHQGLRSITGAFRTSPVESLYVEANEWSLERRRFYLSVSYAFRVRGHPEHPALSFVTETRFKQFFLRKPTVTPPFSMRVLQGIEAYAFTEYHSPVLQPCGRIPPWDPPPKCNYSLGKYQKRDTAPYVLQQEFLYLKESFGDHTAFYTDGSKTVRAVSCAMVTECCTKTHRLPNFVSVFTAELYAIFITLSYILDHRIKCAVIYSDSMSSLQAICSLGKPTNHLVSRARYLVNKAAGKGLCLNFCWVPSHVGITGNEQADTAAAAALSSVISVLEVPSQDLGAVLRRAITKKWQQHWVKHENNKLRLTKNTVHKSAISLHSRFQQVVLTRLRIGHTHLTHGFLLRREEPPHCMHCDEQLSVVHLLISCPLYECQRQRCFREFYAYHIPLHPALLLGDEPFLPFSRIFSFLNDIDVLKAL